MKTSWKIELPQLAILAGMLVLAATSWGVVPESIPVHWGPSGQPDRFGGRAEGLLLLPAGALATYVLMRLLVRLDPGRENYARFAGTYGVIRVAVIAVLGFVYLLSVLSARGVSVDWNLSMGLAVGALFVVLGALMGKIRPNWFVGLRTPWTLSSKLAWTRTHRAGGFLFIGLGLALVVAAFAIPQQLYLVVVLGALGVVAFSFAYSYAVWRRDPDRVPPAGTRPG